MIMRKSYHEMMMFDSFADRFEYLKLSGTAYEKTFGDDRYLNQMLYQSPEWKSVRQKVILRDRACDLAHPDYEIRLGRVIIHHINPLTPEDILDKRANLFDLDNLVLTSFNTHQAIHYGDAELLKLELHERKPNDTCPWKESKALVTLIIGLPGSGKTTLATHLLRNRDGLCYDLDKLADALSLQQTSYTTEMSAARKMADALIKSFLKLAPEYTNNIVVIRAAPTASELNEIKPDRIIVCNDVFVNRPNQRNAQGLTVRINNVVEWATRKGIPVERRSQYS